MLGLAQDELRRNARGIIQYFPHAGRRNIVDDHAEWLYAIRYPSRNNIMGARKKLKSTERAATYQFMVTLTAHRIASYIYHGFVAFGRRGSVRRVTDRFKIIIYTNLYELVAYVDLQNAVRRCNLSRYTDVRPRNQQRHEHNRRLCGSVAPESPALLLLHPLGITLHLSLQPPARAGRPPVRGRSRSGRRVPVPQASARRFPISSLSAR